MSARARRLVSFVVALVGVAGLAAPAGADDGSTVSGTLYSSPTPLPNVRSLTGSVTPFGNVQGLLTLSIDPTTGQFTGYFAISNRRGIIVGTVSGYFTGPASYDETITFVAGTGAYWGISGHATLKGSLDAAGKGTDVVTGGTVYLP